MCIVVACAYTIRGIILGRIPFECLHLRQLYFSCCLFEKTCTHLCTYVYIHSFIHTYIQTYIHTQTDKSLYAQLSPELRSLASTPTYEELAEEFQTLKTRWAENRALSPLSAEGRLSSANETPSGGLPEMCPRRKSGDPARAPRLCSSPENNTPSTALHVSSPPSSALRSNLLPKVSLRGCQPTTETARLRSRSLEYFSVR